MKLIIIKKDKSEEIFDLIKLANGIRLASNLALQPISEAVITRICYTVEGILNKEDSKKIPSEYVRELVINTLLQEGFDEIAAIYNDYNNYKTTSLTLMQSNYKSSLDIEHLGSKENSNVDSTIVSSKRCLKLNGVNTNDYIYYFLTAEEREACNKGFIYIHDKAYRQDTFNCCLFDMKTVLSGGFTMGNLFYTEPKTLTTAFDVIGDIILSATSQQYGGFTVPNVDEILAPYAEKSFKRYKQEHFKILTDAGICISDSNREEWEQVAESYAEEQVRREFQQGFQGWEYKFNTVASSRGDYPFIAISFGNTTNRFAQMASEMCLQVRAEGQGAPGFKRPVLFPKLIFLYDENLHGENKPLEYIFKEAIKCSSKSMYPDYLSLTGEGYVASIYKKYNKVISPMGCRAFLSPWFTEGGLEPANDSDTPIFVGRFNIGVVSLNLPLIYADALTKQQDFYELLDYYLQMIREIHKRTYKELSKKKASCNPLAFCEGGLYKGHLKPNDTIAPCLESATASFGITALNELQQMATGHSLVEESNFALDVMQHIDAKVNEFKKEDKILYAIYGTPAENLCGVQVKQFRKLFGRVKNVSDREYVSNSFHCHVSEDITPIQKQDIEYKFWDLFNGGKIQYVKYPINYNLKAIEALVRRAMKLGYYEGVNLALSYCDNCGYQALDMNTCPVCSSDRITKIERMNGYLSYSRVQGDTRLNAAKMAEIKDRKSM